MFEMTKQALRAFMVESFLFGEETGLPSDTESLIGAGIIDSTGVLELVAFIEDRFGFTIADTDIVPDNLDSIDNIAAFVGRNIPNAAAA
ncbi:MAG: acyl carrier protein [Shinella sp.]|nr:acyl carrier protein [Shinella sp.]